MTLYISYINCLFIIIVAKCVEDVWSMLACVLLTELVALCYLYVIPCHAHSKALCSLLVSIGLIEHVELIVKCDIGRC